MASLFPWIKAFHIIAMVAWMASLLVYPRYKLHQAKSQPGEVLFETMKSAAADLRRIIMIPSMVVTWVLGVVLLGLSSGIFAMNWMWVKLLLVVLVTFLHIYFTKIGRRLDSGDSTVSVSKLRLLNEAPFVILICVVLLVVLKPF